MCTCAPTNILLCTISSVPISIYAIFRLGDPLNCHVATMIESEHYCSACERHFRGTEELKSHIFSKVLDRYICCKCGSKFADKRRLHQHFKDHRVQNHPPRLPDFQVDIGKPIDSRMYATFVCKYCDKSFTTHSLFYRHYQDHIMESSEMAKQNNVVEKLYLSIRHFCDVCDMGFLTEQQELDHRKECTGVSTTLCPTCNQSFQTSRKLYLHYNSRHYVLREKMCKLCYGLFDNDRTLVKHIRQFHFNY